MKCYYCSRRLKEKGCSWLAAKPYHPECFAKNKYDDFWRRMRLRGNRKNHERIV